MTTDRSAEAQHYARLKRWLWLADVGLTLVWCWLAQAAGWSHAWAGWAEATSASRWMSVALYGVVFGVLFYLVGLPLHYYSSFLVEHRFHLSNQTPQQWVWRECKQALVAALLGLLFLEGLYFCIGVAPFHWWFLLAVGWWVVTIVLARILPTVIIPLFYRCVPLDDATLRQTLLQLSQQVRVPVMDAFRIDLSRDTKKANAAVVGWGKTRRVLLADTLLGHFTSEEVTAVVAHELGHHRLHHIPVHLVASLVTTTAGFWLLAQWARGALPTGVHDLAMLPSLTIALTVLSVVLMPLHNGLSRSLERQADAFALRVTQAPQAFVATMRKLAVQNLAELQPPWWVEWWFYSHPAIARRIQMAERYSGGAVQN